MFASLLSEHRQRSAPRSASNPAFRHVPSPRLRPSQLFAFPHFNLLRFRIRIREASCCVYFPSLPLFVVTNSRQQLEDQLYRDCGSGGDPHRECCSCLSPRSRQLSSVSSPSSCLATSLTSPLLPCLVMPIRPLLSDRRLPLRPLAPLFAAFPFPFSRFPSLLLSFSPSLFPSPLLPFYFTPLHYETAHNARLLRPCAIRFP